MSNRQGPQRKRPSPDKGKRRSRAKKLTQPAGTLSAAAASCGTYVSMMYGIDNGDGAETAITFVSPMIGAYAPFLTAGIACTVGIFAAASASSWVPNQRIRISASIDPNCSGLIST